MSKLKLKVGDKVKIRVGKDKGREGKIERIFPKKAVALIPNLNIYKKHVKGVTGGQKAGIYDVPRPLALSKLLLICPKCGKPARVGFKKGDGQNSRVCKKCKKVIDK